MSGTPVILIFDVGKTNKKILLFDEYYRMVFEESFQFPESLDEDGFACENISELTSWITTSFNRLMKDPRFVIRAVNFSGYGASFVYLDTNGQVVLPLYNYLKPYPADLKDNFYRTYGGVAEFSKRTASPVLGSLNSGMQLYRLKYEKPELFRKIKYALHLPQYLSSILTGRMYSEITSIGCHTNLWDFSKNEYHEWVAREDIQIVFPPIIASDECIQVTHAEATLCVGVGLHDSSAALIPYLANFTEPFILLSTGTWCISLNPFNNTALTEKELEKDCLCYLSYQGKPVKSSRLFAGYEHEQQVKRLSEFYHVPVEEFNKFQYDSIHAEKLRALKVTELISDSQSNHTLFAERDLNEFEEAEEAYHQLIIDLVTKQFMSTRLVQRGKKVKSIFVDGGFSKNSLYMHLMATVFPETEVYAASVAQASALGAALAIHQYWNKKSLPSDLIELKYYPDPTKQHDH